MLVHPVQYTLLYFVGKVLHAWIKSYVACLSGTSLSFAYYRHNIFLFAQYICLYWCHLSNFHCLSRIFEAINVHRQKCTGTHLSSCSPMSWGLLALFRCSKNTSLAQNEVAVDKELHFLRRQARHGIHSNKNSGLSLFFSTILMKNALSEKTAHLFVIQSSPAATLGLLHPFEYCQKIAFQIFASGNEIFKHFKRDMTGWGASSQTEICSEKKKKIHQSNDLQIP